MYHYRSVSISYQTKAHHAKYHYYLTIIILSYDIWYRLLIYTDRCHCNLGHGLGNAFHKSDNVFRDHSLRGDVECCRRLRLLDGTKTRREASIFGLNSRKILLAVILHWLWCSVLWVYFQNNTNQYLNYNDTLGMHSLPWHLYTYALYTIAVQYIGDYP